MIKEEFKKFKSLKSDIIIFQMAKVASYGLYETLKKDGFSVSHIHIMSSAIGFFSVHSPLRKKVLWLRSLVVSSMLRFVINTSGREYKIIALTRDPVARNVSLMFQQLHHLIKPTLLERQDKRDLSVTELDETQLLTMIFHEQINQFYPLLWFDKELKRIFGVDVYAQPFDMENGYAIMQKGRISLLVLRSENLSEHTEIIREFTGDAAYQTTNDNRGRNKWYGKMYKRFLETYVPAEEFLDRLYSSKYMRHFYTPEMIAKFKRNWMKVDGKAPHE